MRSAQIEDGRHRMWTAMLASLTTCYGCHLTLGSTLSSADGFCHECLERSRSTAADEVGGES